MKKKQQVNTGKKKTKRYYYNEHDDNQVEVLLTRQNKRRLKKNVKRFLQLCLFGLVIAFFVSPLSRVNQIEVTGEKFLSESAIIDQAEISEKSIHAFTYPYFIEKRLNTMPMVASSHVTRGFLNGIKIDVVEREIIAYSLVDNKLTVVDDEGRLMAADVKLLKEIQEKPRLLEFKDQKTLKDFCKELAKVPGHTRALMSDIVFSPDEPYDRTRVQIDMSDGKKVFVRIEDMAGELKYYQEILSQQPDACIYDIYGNKVYASPCE